eukprot:4532609-Pleurochrysis_carterae.AAC.1
MATQQRGSHQSDARTVTATSQHAPAAAPPRLPLSACWRPGGVATPSLDAARRAATLNAAHELSQSGI